jgi:hypothetical protein
MTASLDHNLNAFGEALRGLERTLSESRGQWDDRARQAFDRRYGNMIVSEGRRAGAELQQLAQQLAAAVRLLNELS